MKVRSPAFLFLFICALLSGCATIEKHSVQNVTIESFPANASVYINGEAAGITPLTVPLYRKNTHEIRIEKKGYNSAVKYFTPVPNKASENFVRFGLAEELGRYVDLEPRTMQADLKSDLVPSSLGADPFEKMGAQTQAADRRLEAGEITPAEHKHIIEQILEFFEKQS